MRVAFVIGFFIIVYQLNNIAQLLEDLNKKIRGLPGYEPTPLEGVDTSKFLGRAKC